VLCENAKHHASIQHGSETKKLKAPAALARQSERHRHFIKALRKIDTTWSNPKNKSRDLGLKLICSRQSTNCDGAKPIIHNTKELLEGNPLQSFDMAHKKNIDFKRFDLIPNTSRHIREQFLTNSQVELYDLNYFYDQIENGPQGFSNRPYGDNYCLPKGFKRQHNI
jgi:hypothetical protein